MNSETQRLDWVRDWLQSSPGNFLLGMGIGPSLIPDPDRVIGVQLTITELRHPRVDVRFSRGFGDIGMEAFLLLNGQWTRLEENDQDTELEQI